MTSTSYSKVQQLRDDREGLGGSRGPQNRLEFEVQKRDDTHIAS